MDLREYTVGIDLIYDSSWVPLNVRKGQLKARQISQNGVIKAFLGF
jgi:hypothetical protein